jgi:tetratricopeptide (TPR) repeat protein
MTNAVAQQITNPVSPINGLDVVNAVNGFYSSAFNHTIWLLGSLLTIFGFAIPAVYFVLAKIQLKIREKMLEVKFTQKFEALAKSLQEETEKKFKVLETAIEKEAQISNAKIFYIAGKIMQDAGTFKEALDAYVQAIGSAVQSSDLERVQKFIRYATNHVLPEMNKENFSDAQFVSAIEAIIKSAGAVDPLLKIDVDAFNAALEKAKNREKK